MYKNYSILLLIIFGFQNLMGQEYEITRLPFNTKQYDEFSPEFFQNGVIFCSNKRNDLVLTYTDQEGRSLIDLYLVEKKDSTSWGNVKLFASDLRTPFQEGPTSYAGNMVFITRPIQPPAKKFRNVSQEQEQKMGIFYASLRNNDSWSSVSSVSFNNENYNVMHPAVNESLELLIFSSNMEGGFGGFDLYASRNVNGTWSTPENLGSGINSAGNEAFPYLHASGRLYFASDGKNGIGGLDIFYSWQTSSGWVNPVMLDETFNSTADDFGFIIDNEFNSGYFTSNREGSDDIFSFNAGRPYFEACDSLVENNYCFVFYEDNPLGQDSTSFKLEWDFGNGHKVRGQEAEFCFPGPGDYEINLNLIDTITGDVLFNQATYLLPIEDAVQPYISVPDTVFVNEPITFSAEKTNLPSFSIDQYYWEFDNVGMGTGETASYEFKRQGVYTIKLGITANDNSDQLQKFCVIKPVVVVRKRE